MTDLHDAILDWYDVHQRDLPWRRAEATPWGVMVSEFMLQQTPVVRVLPAWEAWLTR
jgi:A/G-specific adenine glycosylase